MWEIPFLAAFLFLELVEQKSREREQGRRPGTALSGGACASTQKDAQNEDTAPPHKRTRVRVHARKRLAPDNNSQGHVLSHLSWPHALTSLLVLLKAAVHVSAHVRRVSPGVAAVLEDKKEVIFCHYRR